MEHSDKDKKEILTPKEAKDINLQLYVSEEIGWPQK